MQFGETSAGQSGGVDYEVLDRRREGIRHASCDEHVRPAEEHATFLFSGSCAKRSRVQARTAALLRLSLRAKTCRG